MALLCAHMFTNTVSRESLSK